MTKELHSLNTDIQAPERFTYPFCYEPHPLCEMAAKEVQAYIGSHMEIREDADNGKMFGVLVVKMDDGRGLMEEEPAYGFLAAYSGLLAGRNDWDYFVPPVYDAQQPDGHFKTTEREISLTTHLSPLISKKMSQDLQVWLFHQYQLLNARGEVKDLVDIWQSYYSRPKLRQKFPLPPGGTGDCCAPKLLQYAYQQGLKPVCMAEFWWGATTHTELRQHLNYYPACRGKCKPILTWMLEGLDVDPNPELLGFAHLDPKTVYEDEYIVVLDKPSGLLSTPGRIEDYSVETLMRQRYPDAVIAHRLDMGTSGLLIVAKTLEAYRPLQEQFIKHQIKKKYHGKRAVTDYEFLSDDLVALYPQTGRTHQLRIHCAHPDGLGRPIVGDELYGTKGDRLMLHASEIWFTHPVTHQEMHLASSPPFVDSEI